jgi:hypothetical protein
MLETKLRILLKTGLDQVLRSLGVGFEIGRPVHGVDDTGKVKDDIHAADGGPQRILVPAVTDDEADIQSRQGFRLAGFANEAGNLVAPPGQGLSQMAPDESVASRDQGLHPRESTPRSSSSEGRASDCFSGRIHGFSILLKSPEKGKAAWKYPPLIRYAIASERWAGEISSSPARSAIVWADLYFISGSKFSIIQISGCDFVAEKTKCVPSSVLQRGNDTRPVSRLSARESQGFDCPDSDDMARTSYPWPLTAA